MLWRDPLEVEPPAGEAQAALRVLTVHQDELLTALRPSGRIADDTPSIKNNRLHPSIHRKGGGIQARQNLFEVDAPAGEEQAYKYAHIYIHTYIYIHIHYTSTYIHIYLDTYLFKTYIHLST